MKKLMIFCFVICLASLSLAFTPQELFDQVDTASVQLVSSSLKDYSPEDLQTLLSLRNSEGDNFLNAIIRLKAESIALFLLEKGADAFEVAAGESAFSLACALNLSDFAISSVERLQSFDGAQEVYWTGAFEAMKNGDTRLLRLLLEKAVRYRANSSVQAQEALVEAVKNQDAFLMLDLLRSGANLDATDRSGMSSLMISIKNGDNRSALPLVFLGANRNLQDQRGYTAGMFAVERENLEVLGLLLEKDIDLPLKTLGDKDIMDFAIAKNNETAISMLLSEAIAQKRYYILSDWVARLEERRDRKADSIALKMTADRKKLLNELAAALTEYDNALVKDPQNALAVLGRADVFFLMKLYETAFEEYQRAKELYAFYSEAWLGLAKTRMQLADMNPETGQRKGAYEQAREEAKRALEINESYCEAHFYHGMILMRLADYQTGKPREETLKYAIEQFDKAIALNSSYTPAFEAKGDTLRRLSEFKKALDAYAAYLKIDPERLEIYEKRGDTYLEMAETEKAKSKTNEEIANYKSAIAEFEKVVRVDTENERVWKKVGNTYGALQDIAAAEARKARLNGEYKKQDEQEAEAKTYAVKAAEAYKRYLEILERKKIEDDLEIREKLGFSLFYRQDPNEALSVLSAVLERLPGRYACVVGIAMCQLELENYEAALSFFLQASQDERYDTYAAFLHAETLFALARYAEAKAIYEKAVDLRDQKEKGLKIGEVWYQLAFIAAREGRFEDSIALVNKAIQDNPNFAKAYFFKGEELFKHEKYAEALPALIKAVSLDGAYAEKAQWESKAEHVDGVFLKAKGEKDYWTAYAFLKTAIGYDDEARKYDPKSLKALTRYSRNSLDETAYLLEIGDSANALKRAQTLSGVLKSAVLERTFKNRGEVVVPYVQSVYMETRISKKITASEISRSPLLKTDGRIDDCFQLCADLLKEQDKNAAGWMALGLVYELREQIPFAVVCLNNAYEIDPKNGLYILLLSGYHLRNAQAAEALTLLSALPETFAWEPGLWFESYAQAERERLLAEAAMRQREFDGVRDHYERAFERIETYYQDHRMVEAIQESDAIFTIQKNIREKAEQLINLKKTERAYELLKLGLGPQKGVNAVMRGRLSLLAGKGAFYLGRLSEAEALLDVAKKDLPKDSEPLLMQGYVYLEQGRAIKALPELEKALKLSVAGGTETAPILTGLGIAYFDLYLEENTESRLSNAFYYTNRAYAAAPQNVMNLVFKGDLLLSERFRDLAASVYCLALQYLPESSIILNKLSRLKEQ